MFNQKKNYKKILLKLMPSMENGNSLKQLAIVYSVPGARTN